MIDIQEAKDLNVVILDELMGSLMTQELNMKVDDDAKEKKEHNLQVQN